MPDEIGRSAEEREAARLERERRRAERSPGPDLIAEPPRKGPAQEPPEDLDNDGVGLISADGEEASGTRRVSTREGIAARRQREPERGEKRRSRRPTPKPGTRAGHSRGGRLLALLALVVAAAVIWFLAELFQPFAGSPHGKISVTIPAHSSASQIGDLLARQGIISSSFFFQVRATLDGERGALRSGVYHLQLGMSYGTVLKILTTPPPAAKVTEITITPGSRRAEIDARLRSQHVPGSYLAATRSTRLLNLRAYGVRHPPGSLEGFLFPNTYQVLEPVRLETLVNDQLTAFKQSFSRVNFSYARRRHLTPYDVLIIASMIEGEAQTPTDLSLVSSVIYNRLRLGMPLQLDATTRYATGNFNQPLTQSQLNSPSPYNTRIHRGLPPTPINNPGLATIQAAAHPAHTNYLYFVVEPCGRGKEVFTSSYTQFQNYAQGYQAARAKQGGRSPTHC
jgi:UPF0755 protein